MQKNIKIGDKNFEVMSDIAASEGEDFCLPLIEAVQYNKPVIARDTSVFHEVFGGNTPGDLSVIVNRFLVLDQSDEYPISKGMHYLSWQESVAQLIKLLRKH
jgi:hypothetical protein